MKKQPLAQSLGHLLALGSHTVDRVIGFGFTSMRRASESRQPPRPAKGVLGKTARMGRGILKFLGSAGEAYYEKYDELKKK